MINSWSEALAKDNNEAILSLIDDFIANDRLFEEKQFIQAFYIDYKYDSNDLVKAIKYEFRSAEPKK